MVLSKIINVIGICCKWMVLQKEALKEILDQMCNGNCFNSVGGFVIKHKTLNQKILVSFPNQICT
jgi:hypothetical protein